MFEKDDEQIVDSDSETTGKWIRLFTIFYFYFYFFFSPIMHVLYRPQKKSFSLSKTSIPLTHSHHP